MFSEASFLVQIGHNGRRLAKNAVQENHADGAILSPSDYDKSTNREISSNIHNNAGLVFFDPHYYRPESVARSKLLGYEYYQQRGGDNFNTALLETEAERQALSEDLVELQDEFSVDAYIGPARFIDRLSEANLDRWLDLTESFVEVAEEEGRDIPIFASLPVDGFQLNSPTDRDYLLDRVTSIEVSGFYTSVQYDDLNTRLPLSGQENVEAFLDLHANLRSNRYEVISGHSHQIAHLLFGVGINAYASGHYQNLRAFDMDRWHDSGDEIRQQVVRYYSDAVLDSIRVESQLEQIYTEPAFDEDRVRMNSPYELDLFDTSTTPEQADWTFANESWDHWVWAGHQISRKYRGKTIEERIETAENAIEEARDVYGDIEEEVDPMDSVEDEIYDQWEEALENIEDELDKFALSRML